MADEDDVIYVLVIKKKEEDTEKVRREEEKQEDPEKEKRKMKREEDKEEDPEKKRRKVKREEGKEEAAAIHELPEIEKLNVVQATTTETKRNVDILKIIGDEASKANKRVHIVTFNQVKEAVENQTEYPRELSFLVVEQIFYREIQRVLKFPELRFIPCIIFSHTPVLVRRYIWNDGKPRSRECSADIIREFMVGIWSEKFATMRREATKLDDALSTTEKTSSEEEEEEEEPDDGEGE